MWLADCSVWPQCWFLKRRLLSHLSRTVASVHPGICLWGCWRRSGASPGRCQCLCWLPTNRWARASGKEWPGSVENRTRSNENLTSLRVGVREGGGVSWEQKRTNCTECCPLAFGRLTGRVRLLISCFATFAFPLCSIFQAANFKDVF